MTRDIFVQMSYSPLIDWPQLARQVSHCFAHSISPCIPPSIHLCIPPSPSLYPYLPASLPSMYSSLSSSLPYLYYFSLPLPPPSLRPSLYPSLYLSLFLPLSSLSFSILDPSPSPPPLHPSPPLTPLQHILYLFSRTFLKQR